MKINKFSALGNDIVLVEFSGKDLIIDNSAIHQLLNQKKVKYDQWILIRALIDNQNHFEVTIFNRDGSSAENCMNGALCLAKHLESIYKDSKDKLNIKTIFGQWIIKSSKEEKYSVKMELPENKLLNVLPEETNHLGQYKMTLSNNYSIVFSFINIGNPHAVIFTDDIMSNPLILWGDDLQQSKYFPNGVNLSLASIKSRTSMYLRIYERGVGETMACGSGACAAVMAGIEQGYLDHKVTVCFQNGSLDVSYNQSKNIIEVIGSANYLGEIYMDQ